MDELNVDYRAMGERIYSLRYELGLNQERFAEMCGTTRPTISNIENARTHASSDVLSNIAMACGVSVDYLQYGKRFSTDIKIDSLLECDRDFINGYLKLNVEQKEKMMTIMTTFFPEVCL